MAYKARRQIILEDAKAYPGEEIDPVPMEIPVTQRPETMEEQVRRMVRTQLHQVAEDLGAGSFEDEDDFSEDPEMEDILTPFQAVMVDMEAEANPPTHLPDDDPRILWPEGTAPPGHPDHVPPADKEPPSSGGGSEGPADPSPQGGPSQ